VLPPARVGTKPRLDGSSARSVSSGGPSAEYRLEYSPCTTNNENPRGRNAGPGIYAAGCIYPAHSPIHTYIYVAIPFTPRDDFLPQEALKMRTLIEKAIDARAGVTPRKGHPLSQARISIGNFHPQPVPKKISGKFYKLCAGGFMPMKRWLIAIITAGLLLWQVSPALACTTHTIVQGGRVITCMTCCTNFGMCTTTCH
jgi:hypothetical protein